MGGGREKDNEKSKGCTWAVPVLLVLLIAFHVLSNIYLVSIMSAKSPPSGVDSYLLSESFRLYQESRGGNRTPCQVLCNPYGPFFFYLTQPFYFLFGGGVFSSLLLNDAFFAVLIVSAFLTGRELHSDSAGLLAAFLASFYPYVHGMSRVYIYDFGLTAMIALDVYLLLRTKGLLERRSTVLLGVSLGATALIKPVFIIFVVGPLLAVALDSFSFDLFDRTTRKKLGNLLLLLVISFLVYSPLFLTNPVGILHYASKGAIEGKTHPFWDMDNLLTWPKAMMKHEFLYFFSALFFIATGWLIFTKAISSTVKRMLLSSTLIPLFFFTFVVSNKSPRFILPLAVGMSLVSAIFVAGMRPAALRRILILLVVLVGLWQYWMLSYASQDSCASQVGFAHDYFLVYHDFRFTDGWLTGAFRLPPESSGLKEAADALIEDSRELDHGPTVLGTQALFTPFVHLRYLREGSPFQFYLADYTLPLPENLTQPDYVLLLGMPTSGESCLGPPGAGDSENIRFFEEQRDSYRLLVSIPSFPCATLCSSGGNHSIEVYKKSRYASAYPPAAGNAHTS